MKLEEENKKYKEVINKAIELLGNYKHYSTPDEKQNSENEDLVNNAFDILKEVEQMSAKEMFEDLGYDYDFVQNKNSEDTITYHKDNLHIQFNFISKLIILQNDTSQMFYNSAVFMVNNNLLKAINKQIEELGWNK